MDTVVGYDAFRHALTALNPTGLPEENLVGPARVSDKLVDHGGTGNLLLVYREGPNPWGSTGTSPMMILMQSLQLFFSRSIS